MLPRVIDPASEHYRSMIVPMSWCTWRVMISPRNAIYSNIRPFNVVGTRRRAERAAWRQLHRREHRHG